MEKEEYCLIVQPRSSVLMKMTPTHHAILLAISPTFGKTGRFVIKFIQNAKKNLIILLFCLQDASTNCQEMKAKLAEPKTSGELGKLTDYLRYNRTDQLGKHVFFSLQ